MTTISGHKLKPETMARIAREHKAQRIDNSARIIRDLKAKIESWKATGLDMLGRPVDQSDIDCEQTALDEIVARVQSRAN